MRPPRILFVDFAPSPGGSVQSLILLLRHLPRERYQPLVLLSPTVAKLPMVRALELPVFTFDAGQGVAPAFGAAAQSLRASDAAGRMREHGWLGKPWRWASISRRLWLRTRLSARFVTSLIGREAIDLVHMNDALPLAEPGLLAAWRCRRPGVLTMRSFNTIDDFHRLIARLPAAAIFTSPAIREDAMRQVVRFRRSLTIPNAVDLSQFAQQPDRAGLRAEFGLPDDAIVVAVVGRLMRRKGLDVFIRALAQAAHRFPALHGLIVGEEELGEAGLAASLVGLATDLGIADRVHFTGFRSDVPRLLLAADILSFVPAQPEPFGRTVIEAMAAGLPVIGADSGAIPEIVVAGETGLLVPPGDADAQAGALFTLLGDPDRARAMGDAGRRRARDLFSVERQVAVHLELYDSLLAR